jgi:RHS repeat-associated protein
MPTKTTITKGSMTETVSNTYESNVASTNWTILPKTETVVRIYNGTTINTVTSIDYNSKYLPTKKTVKTGQNKDKTVSEENFGYDAFGNITESSVKRYGSADVLTNKYTYSANGRFVLTATNEMGQTTTYQYNDLLGLPTASKDFKNNTTSYAYNSFGKLTKTTFPDGVVGEESLGGVFSTNTVTSPKLTITETGNPKQEILYDVFMREKSRGIQGFDGSMIYSTTEYNSKGEVYRVSEPGSTSRFTTYTYDSYGRPTKTVTPSGKTTAYSYSGKTSTVSEHGFSKTTTLNNDGFTDKISDAAGDIKYSYRADGQPKSITAPDGSVTSFEYDDYGRQTSITDPSAGTVSYAYDKNGYANKQTDAAGKISETVYNKYGQPTSSTVKNGTTTELSTSYVYNSDYLLKSVSAGGTNISYTYDNLLRTKTRAETVGGTGITETYDYTSGKPTKVTYSGLSGTQPPVTEYVYTNNYLRSIKSGSTVIKTINSKNKFGQTTQYTLGNGVVESRVIDVNGNPVQSKAVKGSTAIQEFNYSVDPLRGVLTSRKDNTRNILESFTYDSQRRLTNYTRNGQAAASVVYSPMGNITSKTDAGTLEYNVPGKPYAIGTQTGNLGSVPERVQDITYTGFQRPSTIEENGYKATFTYGPDYVRSKMEIRNSSALQSTRYYLGGCYEKDVPASGSTTERLYIGGNAYNAPAVYIRTGSGAWTLHYIHRDHLGSITAITNTAGTKIAEYSFDPWGRQRNPVNQQAYEPDAAPSLLLGRGYTGHEHLPMFGLVNMNARLYDPVLGRFLSPDPYVQAPEFSQSFNRYSYCLNNPLMYVDESGEFWWMIPAIIGLNWIQGAAANNWNFNPTNWDWNKTTFNVGFSTAQNGSFYAGLTWGNNNAMVGLGMNSNGNPLIVGGELGNTVSADLAKYAAQFSKRIPQHTPSNAAILPWEPSWIDKWSRSDNFFLNFSYEIIDGLALTLQAPFSGPTSLHLTGEPAVGDDMINGYVTTVTTVLPLTKIVTGAKIAVTSVQAVTKGSAKLLTQFSSSTIDDAVVYAMKYKVNHIFGKAVHNLDPLVTKFGGQENTFRAVLNAANGKLPASGVFNNVSVNVGGYNVIIRGSVVNGVPKIGTMFIP